MAKSASLPPNRKSKKDIQHAIIEKIAASLADYRVLLGDKKFDRRIRKTARRLGEDVAKALPRKEKKNKKDTVQQTIEQRADD
jgi:hypothetical protein